MSTYVKSLKKQIELLQGEVELYANAVDCLAGDLADTRGRLAIHEKPASIDASKMAANENAALPFDRVDGEPRSAPSQPGDLWTQGDSAAVIAGSDHAGRSAAQNAEESQRMKSDEMGVEPAAL
ncbi:hypothetical protein RHSP_47682 [Rhizobium freirei PRF 81]|uniref:Uncharacterized protein n=1 Tax=Rhizobium freirei PRF 81 TaxID=363754 RepID=N6U5B7_9HYPH|nr:hypothetical protein [Rhizobium freirei]ENN87814.1 hypothetical protein RHSP_47682 [Rhizobium freirei PRF 81]